MARMMIRHPYSGRPVASSDAAAIAISAMRRPGPSNVTMVLAVLTVLLGYFFFYFIGEPIVFYGGCAFLTGVCGYHALSSLFFGELNIGAVISSQTMLWHALPFSYIVLFGYENYIHEISELYNA